LGHCVSARSPKEKGADALLHPRPFVSFRGGTKCHTIKGLSRLLLSAKKDLSPLGLKAGKLKPNQLVGIEVRHAAHLE
jgi:hypothetical protein